MADPVSLIASIITIVQSLKKISDTIQGIRAHSKAFDKAHQNLPLVEDTLRIAQDCLEGSTSTLPNDAKSAIDNVLGRCKAKASQLKSIFDEVDTQAGTSEVESWWRAYRDKVLRSGKGYRAEALMKDLVEQVQQLGLNQQLRTANGMAEKVDKLEQALKQLSDVEPSVPDSDFENSNVQNMHIDKGGVGYQNHGGKHIHNNAAYSHYYNGDHMTIVLPTQETQTRILQKLYMLPYADRKNQNPEPVEGTCKWFIDHERFRQWQQAMSSTILWVSADPGSGKSVLARFLADSQLQSTQTRITCYFFFKTGVPDQESSRNALACLLHQIFEQKPVLFSRQIADRLDSLGDQLPSSFAELWSSLLVVSQNEKAGEIVCILDAFDECQDEDTGRTALSKALCKFYNGRDATTCKLKFLITSRPYISIGRGFAPLDVMGLLIRLEGDSEQERAKIALEINIFIESRVSDISQHVGLSTAGKDLLLQELRRVPNQTYLWVYLTLHLVARNLAGVDTNDTAVIRRYTSSIPKNVDEAYEKILLKSSDSTQARRLLHLVVAAERPLSVTEMSIALELSNQDHSQMPMGVTPSQEKRFCDHLRNLCGLFVTITESKVYLLHQTAREFLVQSVSPHTSESLSSIESPSMDSIWRSSLMLQESHLIFYETCELYMLYIFSLKSNGLDDIRMRKTYHLLDYAATSWAFHFRASNIAYKSCKDSLLQLCNGHSDYSQMAFRIHWESKHPGRSPPEEFTTLMMASFLGLTGLVEKLVKRADVETIKEVDSRYERSALSWAAENGHDDVLRILLKPQRKWLVIRSHKQIKIDQRDTDGRTPLSYAALGSHLAAVEVLLKAGAQPDIEDKFGGSPIKYAMIGRQDTMIDRMRTKAPDQSVDHILSTMLLSVASGDGNLEMARLLLDKGADVDAAAKDGWTPLYWASMQGHLELARLLLDKGADVDTADEDGRTPLHWALRKGHLEVVGLLLDKGADIKAADVKAADENGRTPLHWASEKRHLELTRLLLDRGADVDAAAKDGRTPLYEASEKGHHEVVKLLLDRGANVNAADESGGTPLHWASEKGHHEVVRLLLGMGADIKAADVKAADVKAADENGRTPLHWASEKGHLGLARLLLGRGADVDAVDKDGRTLLYWALRKGNLKLAKLLIDKGADIKAADVKAADENGRTPLHWALEKRHLELARLLLGMGADIKAADVKAADENGRTPLHWASEKRHLELARLLLGMGADVDAVDKDGRTPLYRALRKGNLKLAKLLIDKGADVSAAAEDSLTKGQLKMVELLSNKGRVHLK